MVCQWNLNLWELSGSVCGFTGASVNSKERLGARVGLCNFDGASGIFGSVCEMYCTKKITPWKNFSFSLHEQDQGVKKTTEQKISQYMFIHKYYACAYCFKICNSHILRSWSQNPSLKSSLNYQFSCQSGNIKKQENYQLSAREECFDILNMWRWQRSSLILILMKITA